LFYLYISISSISISSISISSISICICNSISICIITGAPKLTEVTSDLLDVFSSKSVPVATKARLCHNEEMKLLNQAWWRKLSDHLQDNAYEDNQVLL